MLRGERRMKKDGLAFEKNFGSCVYNSSFIQGSLSRMLFEKKNIAIGFELNLSNIGFFLNFQGVVVLVENFFFSLIMGNVGPGFIGVIKQFISMGMDEINV